METTRRDNQPPWERRNSNGFFPAFVQTTLALLTSPSRVYRGLDPESSPGEAIFYGLIMCFLGGIILSLWLIAGGIEPVIGVFLTPAYFITAGLMGILLFSALLQLWIQLLYDTHADLSGTVQVVAYAQVGQLFHLLPYAGPLLFLLVFLVLTTKGVGLLHDKTTLRSALLVLVTTLLTWGAIVFFLYDTAANFYIVLSAT